ncbi:MAG: Long-chain-aldehyde dehydrogenase [Burkholderia lata]|uniref:Long-chain-aldehyde dehydrogenase n=1 Tax=Burkholderia lata (strain ATCC 17760 / DSM 23089 / LMG 22485 / NCIMB 9086 / R18194 / 383) TaxID=482957 RepID=A0A833UY35_BURL3|nr:MAG: Long-chain-aldehyde dehydrogenase [Burkholderia lata]
MAPPVAGQYFDNISPVTGQPFTAIPRSQEADIELALDAAHAAKAGWGATPAADRAAVLLRIADRMEQNLARLAVAETIDNGKPLRETTATDIPLAIDHFRYFAGFLRAQEGSIAYIGGDLVAYHFHEPLGVVGQIIPWNFPILMAAWKLAPALAVGNCVVLKPTEQTPASILVWAELVQDLLPPGVLNIFNGFGLEAGKPLASSKRIAKIAFTGETTTGRLIMQYASANLIPVTLELGGKSPNIFFADVMDRDDGYFDKALEGFAMFALNQGEVCTCPSRALVEESVYERFIERAVKRVEKIRQGPPLDAQTMIGAQASTGQMEKMALLKFEWMKRAAGVRKPTSQNGIFPPLAPPQGGEVLAAGRARGPGGARLCLARALKRARRFLRIQGSLRRASPALDPEKSTHSKFKRGEKILSYIDIGRQEGAECLTGGERNTLTGELASGYYVKPTVFRGHNKMRIFQEEIFGPVLSVTTFKNEEEALEISNDTLYGLGAGVWTRDDTRVYRFGRAIQAGRVWTNCYHAYPAHAAFGGYKQSGIGRETHKMMLDHYQQTKNLLVSYSEKPLGFF